MKKEFIKYLYKRLSWYTSMKIYQPKMNFDDQTMDGYVFNFPKELKDLSENTIHIRYRASSFEVSQLRIELESLRNEGFNFSCSTMEEEHPETSASRAPQWILNANIDIRTIDENLLKSICGITKYDL
jgi:hypothetical protein